MRLAPDAGWTATLSARDLGDANDFTLTELEARRIARRLREAGINWNLAPVVDVGYNPANPVIVGTARAFSANPWLVAEHARAFIRGMHAEGVLTALKHFPGHGSSYADSHEGFVDVTDTASAEVELAPYRMLIAEGLADAVMTAHVWNRRLGPERPAPLSRATVAGLLRGVLGFDGPVVSDDLRMGAIEQRYGLGAAAALALDAGVDLLLIAAHRLPHRGPRGPARGAPAGAGARTARPRARRLRPGARGRAPGAPGAVARRPRVRGLGGVGGALSGPPTSPVAGRCRRDRGAPRLRRGAPSAGGWGGPCRGPPRHQSRDAVDVVEVGHRFAGAL